MLLRLPCDLLSLLLRLVRNVLALLLSIGRTAGRIRLMTYGHSVVLSC